MKIKLFLLLLALSQYGCTQKQSLENNHEKDLYHQSLEDSLDALYTTILNTPNSAETRKQLWNVAEQYGETGNATKYLKVLKGVAKLAAEQRDSMQLAETY